MCCNISVTVGLSFYTGESQCLVKLFSMPLAVCRGTGASPMEAQINAAQNLLEYIKIVTNE